MILITTCFRAENAWIRRHTGVVLVRTAMGERATDAAERAVGRTGATLLLSAGFCGALEPGLTTGDVIVAEAIDDRRGRMEVDPALVARARSRLAAIGLRAVVGRLRTVPGVVRSPEEKKELRLGGALAIDMESAPLARWARDRGVAFLSLRVVLDRADEGLPAVGSGVPSWTLAARPITVSRLALSAFVAGRALGRAASVVLAEAEGGEG
jgi:adenosylhomocysteine nucleosidase